MNLDAKTILDRFTQVRNQYSSAKTELNHSEELVKEWLKIVLESSEISNRYKKQIREEWKNFLEQPPKRSDVPDVDI